MNEELKELNTPEPKPVIILRLLAEAKVGKKFEVSICDALEFRREQYGLTKNEWAAVLGISASHYSEFTNGKRSLPLSATKRAFAVGVPAELLLQS